MRIVLMPNSTPIFEGFLTEAQLAALQALYAYSGKIAAIKWLRSAYPGSTLGSTKTAVEDLIAHYDWKQVEHSNHNLSLGGILYSALEQRT